MRAERSSTGGMMILVAGGLLAGWLVFGSLLKLALAVGAAALAYKVFFEPKRAPLPPAPAAVALPPLDVHALELAEDEERARLDRELERAIQAANARSAAS